MLSLIGSDKENVLPPGIRPIAYDSIYVQLLNVILWPSTDFTSAIQLNTIHIYKTFIWFQKCYNFAKSAFGQQKKKHKYNVRP